MVGKHAWLVAALLACGGKTKQPATVTGSDGSSCEPGRCLEDFAKQIQELRPQTRACYEAMLTQKPRIQGRLIINFKVGPDGDVTETSQGMQEDQISDETLVECVSDVLKAARFAKSAAGKTTRAYHEFEFTPQGK
jgi:hypothetical protein